MQPSKLIPTLTLLLSVSNTAAGATPLPPTTAPATFTAGLDGNATGTFTTSPAPATLHVSALGLTAQPTDWLDELYAWDFGDAAGKQTVTSPLTGQPVNLDTALTGPVAAYVYESPGTYTVTLTRTTAAGVVSTYRATVTVPPAARTSLYVAPTGNDANAGTDSAHPLKTAAAAAKRLKDHTALLFQRGGTYPTTDALPLMHDDLLVDCYGDGAQPLPVLQMTNPAKLRTDNALLFTTWPGNTADVTLRHLRVDNPWTAATTASGYGYHQAVSCFGTLRGRNVTLEDVELANVSEGPDGSPALAGGMMLRVRQVDPLGIQGRVLWLEGTDVVAIGCVATNSANESPLRADGTGIVRGLVALNDIAQQADPAHGRVALKPAVALRALADVAVVDNHVSDAELCLDPLSAAAVDQRVAVTGNALDGSMLHLKTNVRHAVFRDNTLTVASGPCVGISPGSDGSTEWIEDVRVEHNAGRGWMADGHLLTVDAHADTALRKFTADPAVNVYQRIAAPR
jgi:hypothetical protein